MLFERQRNQTRSSFEFFAAPRTGGSDNSSSIAYMRDLLRLAEGCCLTKRQRQLVALYYYEGQTMPQIACKLGLNVSTVSRHLQAARGRIVAFARQAQEVQKL